jgi:hypothetical protein
MNEKFVIDGWCFLLKKECLKLCMCSNNKTTSPTYLVYKYYVEELNLARKVVKAWEFVQENNQFKLLDNNEKLGNYKNHELVSNLDDDWYDIKD